MVFIYTFADKRADFIGIQAQLFEKFLIDKYTFIVVNAGSTYNHKKLISAACKKWSLEELNFPVLNTYPPAPACSIPIQWCWDNYIINDDENISVIIDSDMFMFKEFSVIKYMEDCDLAGHYDKRGIINYLWNGILFFSPNLPNKQSVVFAEGYIGNYLTDVGGNLYYYINNNNLRIKKIYYTGKICSRNHNIHLLPKEIISYYKDEYLCELFEQVFFHYRAGSNWNGMSIDHHFEKSNMLQILISRVFQNNLTIPDIDSYQFHQISNVWDIDWPQNITPYTRFIKNQWIESI